MSIINYQTSVLLDRETFSETTQNQNITDNTEIPITNSTINTYTDDGEKISQADFNTKKTYKLYNYTQDQTEQTYTTYNSTSRTAKIAGYAGNTGLFTYHMGLMKFLPLLVVHLHPELITRAIGTIANISKANYLYITAYPTYSGYKIEHDPTLTIYLTTETTQPIQNWFGILVIGGIIAIIVAGTIIAIRRRKPKQPQPTPQPQQTIQTP
jgi:hypothetical protein